MRAQRVGERLADALFLAVHDAHARSLDGVDGRQRAYLAQPAVGADGEIEPRGIGAIDDVDVVVAGQHEHAVGDCWVGGEGIEELGPFAGTAGVRCVAGDENRVERRRGVDLLELREQPAKATIALRARSAAFDAKTVALADDVNVGQVCNAPGAGAGRRRGKSWKIARRRHGRVGETPCEGRHGEIGADDDDGIGERHPSQLAGGEKIADPADPARRRPGCEQYQEARRR